MHDIFYFTDVHGQLDLFQTMRDWCLKQDPECCIIYGGDACDRGDFGYDIMEAILDDPQMIYIRGNHEDLFLKAALEIIGNHPEIANKSLSIQEAEDIIDECSWGHFVRLHLHNGGRPTLKGWMLDGTSLEFLHNLAARTCLTVDADFGLKFSHSCPKRETWVRVNNAEYNGDEPNPIDEEEVIWSREDFGSWWNKGEVIIFGHTPTCYMSDWVWELPRMRENEMKPVAYRSKRDSDDHGWHIDMDTGMTWTGRGYVLNCLTMQVTGFYDPKVMNPNDNRPVEQEVENFQII